MGIDFGIATGVMAIIGLMIYLGVSAYHRIETSRRVKQKATNKMLHHRQIIDDHESE